MTPEQKRWIDESNLVTLLRLWRHGKIGDTIFQGEVGDYFKEQLFGMRDADPAAWTATSKQVGW